jgi:membrane dipeptidase
MNRRDAIGWLSGAAGTLALSPFAAARSQAAPTTELYRNATVIVGNMDAPLDDKVHLSPKLVDQVRSSGITALKMTLGGGDYKNKAQTDAQIAEFDRSIALNSDIYIKVSSLDDLKKAKSEGKVGIIYSFEGGAMLEGQLENIEHFRRAGVLVMGLTYNLKTPFASGTMEPEPTGLTALGREAVIRMNAQGIMLDISHCDDPSSFGAIAASDKPVSITHTGCDAVHPHPRNKSDMLLRALAERGGVVGIYELSYLVAPPKHPTLDDYMAHMLHALNVCGEDHVGIGTDGLLKTFDTSPEKMKLWNDGIAYRKAIGIAAPGEGPPPFVVGLNRPDRCLVIAEELVRRGYPPRVAEKVLGKNFERIFTETWRMV